MIEEHKSIRKESRQATLEKRKKQECKCYTLKIDNNHLNKAQKNFLTKVFLEAKWFYNYVLSQNDVFNSSIRKDTEVTVKKLDDYENRTLSILSAQMKTGLHERICFAIKGVSTKKKKGRTKEVGRLKFTKEVNSVELKQFGTTWKFKKSRIKIQNCKTPFKIFGLEQISQNVEFANAKLIRKPSGYYIQITTFQNKEHTVSQNRSVGIDFGIKDSIITSDGVKFNIHKPETKKLKRLQLWFSKKTKGSKNRLKLKHKIQKEYEKIGNRKKDQVNKIVSFLTTNYDNIVIQDEQIANWHKGWFGKQVQHSALEAIKTKLKNLESTQVISKWEPTTKLCPSCGSINPITLVDRIYSCDCGYSQDRDIHSAKNILIMGQSKSYSLVEHKSTRSEDKISAKINFSVLVSQDPVKREAKGL